MHFICAVNASITAVFMLPAQSVQLLSLAQGHAIVCIRQIICSVFMGSNRMGVTGFVVIAKSDS